MGARANRLAAQPYRGRCHYWGVGRNPRMMSFLEERAQRCRPVLGPQPKTCVATPFGGCGPRPNNWQKFGRLRLVAKTGLSAELLGTLLGFRLHRIPGRLHRLLRIRLLTFQIFLPVWLANLELRQAELLIRNRFRDLQLIQNQWYPVLPPRRLLLRPLVVVRQVRRNLPRMGGRRPSNRVLPDPV